MLPCVFVVTVHSHRTPTWKSTAVLPCVFTVTIPSHRAPTQRSSEVLLCVFVVTVPCLRAPTQRSTAVLPSLVVVTVHSHRAPTYRRVQQCYPVSLQQLYPVYIYQSTVAVSTQYELPSKHTSWDNSTRINGKNCNGSRIYEWKSQVGRTYFLFKIRTRALFDGSSDLFLRRLL